MNKIIRSLNNRGQMGMNGVNCLFLFIYTFLSSVSYRQFTQLLWEFAGHSKHYPLPCCPYKAIWTALPSESGQCHGFEDYEQQKLFILTSRLQSLNNVSRVLIQKMIKEHMRLDVPCDLSLSCILRGIFLVF